MGELKPVLDSKGKVIKIGAYVKVTPPRSDMAPESELPTYSAFVDEVVVSNGRVCLFLSEATSGAHRVSLPADVRIKKNTTGRVAGEDPVDRRLRAITRKRGRKA